MATLSNYDTLIFAIDIRKAIRENNIELAKSIVEKINLVDLTDELSAIIEEATAVNIIMDCEKFDACKYILNNMNYIDLKQYKLIIADLYEKFRSGSKEEVSNWIKDNYSNLLEMSLGKELYFIGKSLISICSSCERFDIMEDIRTKLEELRTKMEAGE